MKLIIKTTLALLILVISAEGANAQKAPKKPQLDVNKLNKQRDRVKLKAAEQQDQLRYTPVNSSHVSATYRSASDSLAILRNRQAAVNPKQQ